MSHNGDIARLIKIMTYISGIEEIIARHKGATAALKDTEGQYALMMCLLQIGELSNRIKDEKILHELPIHEAVSFRNRIAHEYNGILMDIAEETLTRSIPEMKTKIITFLKRFPEFSEWEKLWQK
jgi:uncharacterized protein with HEPN domain